MSSCGFKPSAPQKKKNDWRRQKTTIGTKDTSTKQSLHRRKTKRLVIRRSQFVWRFLVGLDMAQDTINLVSSSVAKSQTRLKNVKTSGLLETKNSWGQRGMRPPRSQFVSRAQQTAMYHDLLPTTCLPISLVGPLKNLLADRVEIGDGNQACTHATNHRRRRSANRLLPKPGGVPHAYGLVQRRRYHVVVLLGNKTRQDIRT